MPLALNTLTEEELLFSIALQDGYLFAMLFWPDDFSLPLSVEQKILMLDTSKKQVWSLGRKILKTLSIERDIMWSVVMHFLKNTTTLYESMFVTPREAHMVPVRDRVFAKINQEPFFYGLIKEKNKSGGGSGMIESVNGYKWHFRIEGISGTDENVVGIRAHKVIKDEGAFGNWGVHNSLIMTAYPDADWKITGVPNGVRGTPFYEIDTKPEKFKGWSRHKYSTYINPLYKSPELKQELIDSYGGETTQGYKTQVLGEWGDEAFSSFPTDSIAIDKSKQAPKVIRELIRKQILDNESSLSSLLPFPRFQNVQYCIGLDYGYSPDPTEICIAYSYGDGIWRQLSRIRLTRVEMPLQATFINWLVSVPLENRVVRISTDDIKFVQTMNDRDKFGDKYVNIMHFANVGGSTLITDASGVPILDSTGKEIKKRNKQYYTDELKQIFYHTLLNSPYPVKLWLAEDSFLIDALTGLTETKTEGGYTVYECAKKEEEHAKDALLYLVSAILTTVNTTFSENWNELSSILGWVGPDSAKGWVAPW